VRGVGVRSDGTVTLFSNPAFQAKLLSVRLHARWHPIGGMAIRTMNGLPAGLGQQQPGMGGGVRSRSDRNGSAVNARASERKRSLPPLPSRICTRPL